MYICHLKCERNFRLDHMVVINRIKDSQQLAASCSSSTQKAACESTSNTKSEPTMMSVTHGVPDTAAYSRPAKPIHAAKLEAAIGRCCTLQEHMRMHSPAHVLYRSLCAAPVLRCLFASPAVRRIGKPWAGSIPRVRAIIAEFTSMLSMAKHPTLQLSSQVRLRHLLVR